MGDRRSIPQRIRDAREESGLTQEEVAVLLGVSRETYFKVEKGIREPRRDEIALMSDELGMSYGEFFF